MARSARPRGEPEPVHFYPTPIKRTPMGLVLSCMSYTSSLRTLFSLYKELDSFPVLLNKRFQSSRSPACWLAANGWKEPFDLEPPRRETFGHPPPHRNEPRSGTQETRCASGSSTLSQKLGSGLRWSYSSGEMCQGGQIDGC